MHNEKNERPKRAVTEITITNVKQVQEGPIQNRVMIGSFGDDRIDGSNETNF
jgi:hypothetical protein